MAYGAAIVEDLTLVSCLSDCMPKAGLPSGQHLLVAGARRQANQGAQLRVQGRKAILHHFKVGSTISL